MFTFDHVFTAITGLCEISIWWMILQDYRKDRGRTELRMPKMKWFLMIALSLVPIGALVYNKQDASLAGPPPKGCSGV